MDDRRFDDLSRWLGDLTAPALSRRAVTRLAGGAALAGAVDLAVLSTEIADAKKKKKKKKKKKDKNKKKDKDKDKKDGKCHTGVQFSFTFGSFGTDNGLFRSPLGISIDSNEDIYVSDNGNQRIQVFDKNSTFLRAWGSQGNGDQQFQIPTSVVVNKDRNNRVFVTDPGQTNSDKKFRKYTTGGDFDNDLGQSDLGNPRGIAVDEDKNLWVVDAAATGAVFLFDSGGNFRASFTPDGNGALQNPEGIGVFDDDDGDRFVFVADTGNNRLVKFRHDDNNNDGLRFIDAAGSGGSGSDRFNQPAGMAVDSCGNIWVADRLNNRIQRLDVDLNFRNRFSSSFNRPTDVALGPRDGSLYVVDSENDQIQKFNLK